jgi:hypothetical protein
VALECDDDQVFCSSSGAQIKVRCGAGFLGFDNQRQTLNGRDTKDLSVGGASIAYARMQMKVHESAEVTSRITP